MRAVLTIVPTTLALLGGVAMPASAEDLAKKPLQATAPGPEGAQHVTPTVNLADADRDAVKKAILAADTHQPTPAKFEPQVGADVPQTVYVHALPQDVIRDRPALKQMMYAHLDRSIVLIDGVQKKVTAVIPLSEAEANTAKRVDAKKASVAAVGGLPNLDDGKKRAIYATVQAQSAQPAPPGEPMRAGVVAPASLQLAPLPQEVAAHAPEFAGKAFVKLDDGRLLIVDPGSRTVAGVITKDEGTQTAQGGPSGDLARDAIRANEQSGDASAYTGPTSMGQTNVGPGNTGQSGSTGQTAPAGRTGDK